MRPTARARALLLVVAALAAAGCAHRAASPLAVLQDAARDASRPGARARTLALAGFHSWLVDRDPARAKDLFDQAVKADPAEPWALQGQHLLALRAAHPEIALTAALDLLDRAPAHPLAVGAARYALDLIGTSTSLDDRIVARARALLARGARGDVALLLRSAIAAVHAQRAEADAHARVLAEMGVADTWTLAGPFSSFHILHFDEKTPPEANGSLAGPFTGPHGAIVPRPLRFPDGRLGLSGEPWGADMYALAADIDVSVPGDYIVRSVSGAPLKVWLDGTLLFESRAFARAEPTVGARGVRLGGRRHRLLIKISNLDGAADLSVYVLRADGQPSQLRFSPAQGPAASWAGVSVFTPDRTWPRAAEYAKALEGEAGGALAAFIAIRDAMTRDSDGAWRLMGPLAAALPDSPAVTGLRAELALADEDAPQRISRARATRDLEATVEKDPRAVSALLARARLALNDNRQSEAVEWMKRARAADGSPGFPVTLLRARIDLALGLDAQAGEAADEALRAQPDLCDAHALRYDLARKRDATALADEILGQLRGCPGTLARTAEHARSRGRIDESIAAYESIVARDPSQLGNVFSLVQLYVSARRFADAERSLRALQALWPRNAEILRRLAEVLEHAGQEQQALAAREQALALAGGDLSLRRRVHRDKTGKELLSEHAIDGKAAIAAYEERRGAEDAAAVMVLDAATVEAFSDASSVDRIHVIEKALSQEGVAQIAEVNLPGDAQVLTLRTIKKDGRVLEPEDIAGKETISMPGVQVGDYVEYEFLQAHSPRGAAQPGFTAPAFYFQLAGEPNAWSTYTVIAPAGAGLTADAHNMKVPATRVEGGREIFSHVERHVAPLIPEPNAPPSANEYLPWVQVGTGARGNEGLVSVYADAFLSRGRITHEVESFARAEVGKSRGEEAVRALHRAVMKKLRGADAGLSVSASTSIAQDRGSRLWALKGALEALGFPTRVAAVRTADADPAPYVFPNEGLLSYLCLRTSLPDGRAIWLDTSVRLSPFGALPESAVGREAWLLPEPGRPLEKTTTPKEDPPKAKDVAFVLELTPEGDLRGTGEERYAGYEAASVGAFLERTPPDQREQALQGALAVYFNGAEMDQLRVDLPEEPGEELVLRYAFRVPAFARKEGERMVVSAVTYPTLLGRRFAQVGARATPLYVSEGEQTRTRVELTLPPGYALNGPLGEVKVTSAFGSLIRREVQDGRTLKVEEQFQLGPGRILPARYEDFTHFAGEVDLLQQRDLVFERRPGA